MEGLSEMKTKQANEYFKKVDRMFTQINKHD